MFTCMFYVFRIFSQSDISQRSSTQEETQVLWNQRNLTLHFFILISEQELKAAPWLLLPLYIIIKGAVSQICSVSLNSH